MESMERNAWIVEMEIGVGPSRVEKVTKGLPRTRKKRRARERSRVTLRSSKEEMMWFWEGLEAGEEKVRSALKAWKTKEDVTTREGKHMEREELKHLIR